MGKPDGYDAMGDVVNPKVSRWFAESLPKYMNPTSAPGQAVEDLGGLWTEHVADPAVAAIGAKMDPENELLMRRIATSGFGASKEGMANFQGSQRGQQGMASLDKNLGAASPAVLTATDALPFFLQQALLAKGALGGMAKGEVAAKSLPQDAFAGPRQLIPGRDGSPWGQPPLFDGPPGPLPGPARDAAGYIKGPPIQESFTGEYGPNAEAVRSWGLPNKGVGPAPLQGPAGYNLDRAGFRPDYPKPSYPNKMMDDISAEKYAAENESRATGKLDIPNWLVDEKGMSTPRPISGGASVAGSAPEMPSPPEVGSLDRAEDWSQFWADKTSSPDSVTRTDLVNWLLQKSRSQPPGGGGL